MNLCEMSCQTSFERIHLSAVSHDSSECLVREIQNRKYVTIDSKPDSSSKYYSEISTRKTEKEIISVHRGIYFFTMCSL